MGHAALRPAPVCGPAGTGRPGSVTSMMTAGSTRREMLAAIKPGRPLGVARRRPSRSASPQRRAVGMGGMPVGQRHGVREQPLRPGRSAVPPPLAGRRGAGPAWARASHATCSVTGLLLGSHRRCGLPVCSLAGGRLRCGGLPCGRLPPLRVPPTSVPATVSSGASLLWPRPRPAPSGAGSGACVLAPPPVIDGVGGLFPWAPGTPGSLGAPSRRSRPPPRRPPRAGTSVPREPRRGEPGPTQPPGSPNRTSGPAAFLQDQHPGRRVSPRPQRASRCRPGGALTRSHGGRRASTKTRPAHRAYSWGSGGPAAGVRRGQPQCSAGLAAAIRLAKPRVVRRAGCGCPAYRPPVLCAALIGAAVIPGAIRGQIRPEVGHRLPLLAAAAPSPPSRSVRGDAVLIQPYPRRRPAGAPQDLGEISLRAAAAFRG